MAAARSNPAALASAGLRSARTPRTLQRKTAGCERRTGGGTSTFTVHSKVWHRRPWPPDCVKSLTQGWGMGWPIRRVLSSRAVAGEGVATIHLRTPLPTPSSGLPGHSGEQPSIVPCLALLRVGFT